MEIPLTLDLEGRWMQTMEFSPLVKMSIIGSLTRSSSLSRGKRMQSVDGVTREAAEGAHHHAMLTTPSCLPIYSSDMLHTAAAFGMYV